MDKNITRTYTKEHWYRSKRIGINITFQISEEMSAEDRKKFERAVKRMFKVLDNIEAENDAPAAQLEGSDGK